jgi:Ca2+-transporting ATPase
LIAIVTTIAMGLPLPYIPAQILWLNLVTNGLQDIALAFEPGEKGILERPPRERRERILSPLIIRRTLVVGIVLAAGTLYTFIHALNTGLPLDKARTIALTTMVFFQFYQAFNCRSETESIFRMNPLGNPFLFFSVIAALLAQLAVLYLPSLQWVFRTVPLTAYEWLEIGIVSSTIIAAVEVDKLFIRRRKYG